MLATLKDLMEIAERNGNAIGMFDVPGLDCIQAVIGAAEELGQPVIIAQAEVHNTLVDIDILAPAMIAAAAKSKVPVCVHLDHGESLDLIDKALDLGFTSVMIDASTRPFEENLAITRSVVEKCHRLGVDVEAELGRLPTREGGASTGPVDPREYYTDAEQARQFVRETGVDALAIAFGTAHGFYKQTPVLDFDVVSSCRESTGIPLVMHGGSGVSPEDYVKAIKAGIRKINYYSYMSKAGYQAAGEIIASNTTSFFHDAVFAAMRAMKEDALKAMKVFTTLQVG